MTRAQVERIVNAEAFRQKLSQEQGTLSVLLETVHGLQFEETISAAEACRLFEERRTDYSHHLHFRAFHETTEYAWLGTEGIAVTIGTEGDYEVHDKSQAEEGVLLRAFLYSAGGERRLVSLQNIVSKGRVIYQKMRSLQGSRDNAHL